MLIKLLKSLFSQNEVETVTIKDVGHRVTPREGVLIIKKWEGLRLEAYQDVAGLWTIGYGHLMKDKNEFGGVLEDERHAERILRQDLYRTEKAVLRLTKVPLTDNQYSALVSFVFNVGAGAYQRSTLRQKLNRGDYLGAQKEFHKWVYAGGRRIVGLIKRRQDEARIFGYD